MSGQIRFMSPERGVMQLAACAILNAVWDLWAKSQYKPLWRLVVDMTPEEFVGCIDFRYLTDVLTKEEAIEMLRKQEQGKEERLKLALSNQAVPGYNTSVGWLGLCELDRAGRQCCVLTPISRRASRSRRQGSPRPGLPALQAQSRYRSRHRPSTSRHVATTRRGRRGDHGQWKSHCD